MSQHVPFKRNIGLFMAVMIGIGAMMGPGIFALPGELAEMVGPLGILAYLAMGVVTILTAAQEVGTSRRAPTRWAELHRDLEMEAMGLEPTTSGLQSPRSPN